MYPKVSEESFSLVQCTRRQARCLVLLLLSQLSSRFIFSLGKSIILVIGESPTTVQVLEELEIRGQVETIQTTTILRSARIPRRVLET